MRFGLIALGFLMMSQNVLAQQQCLEALQRLDTLQIMGRSGQAVFRCEPTGAWSIEKKNLDVTKHPDKTNDQLIPDARAVQQFLSEQPNSGLDCSRQQCAGQLDSRTIDAIITFLKNNLSVITQEERLKWGLENQAQVDNAIRSKSHKDIITLFSEIFDIKRSLN